jgi:two-component system phosphate regulon response regulator PhoB
VPKYKVLLADDDPGLRKLVGTTLGTDDFNLYHAADGEETLAVARAERPDIILLDINMPKKNGLEVCREIKGAPDTAAIKVVMLTASGSDADKVGALEARADDYFVKPFSPVALLNKIYELVGHA